MWELQIQERGLGKKANVDSLNFILKLISVLLLKQFHSIKLYDAVELLKVDESYPGFFKIRPRIEFLS